jgi:uncharacterized protein YbcI
MADLQTRDIQTSGSGGPLRVAMSNAMVRIWKQHYGRGPTAARAFFEAQFVFVVLEDGLTRNEQTLLDAGHEDAVRQFRLCFQETMRSEFQAEVERLTGRTVLAHECQFTFAPMMTFEIFVLDAPVEDQDH